MIERLKKYEGIDMDKQRHPGNPNFTVRDTIKLADEVAELRQFLDAAIADARYFEKQRDVLLVALYDCSFALNQFDPYDDIECLWQIKSDVDVDSVLRAARNAISIVKGNP